MHPELIPGFPVRSFGVMLVIGVAVALWLALRRADRFGVPKDRVWDAILWLVFPGVLGARVLFILQDLPTYLADTSKLFTLQFEGLTSFGGLIGGYLGFLLWSRKYKVDRASALDCFAVPVLVAHAIGRIGCLLNGCCYGRATDSFLGVRFLGLAEPHLPAQIFDSGMTLLFAVALLAWERRGLAKGQSFALMLAAYGLSRFIYEFFRAGSIEEVRIGLASSTRMGSLPITEGHVAALVVIVLGFALFILAGRKSQREPAPAQG